MLLFAGRSAANWNFRKHFCDFSEYVRYATCCKTFFHRFHILLKFNMAVTKLEIVSAELVYIEFNVFMDRYSVIMIIYLFIPY